MASAAKSSYLQDVTCELSIVWTSPYSSFIISTAWKLMGATRRDAWWWFKFVVVSIELSILLLVFAGSEACKYFQDIRLAMHDCVKFLWQIPLKPNQMHQWLGGMKFGLAGYNKSCCGLHKWLSIVIQTGFICKPMVSDALLTILSFCLMMFLDHCM